MPTAVPPVVASAPVVPPSNVPNPDAPDIQSPPMSAGSVLSGATPGPTNPRATFKNSFQAGLQRPKYTTDDQGQISRVNEGTSSPKGFLGSVLAGAVVGALHGAAATKRGQRGGAAFGSGVAEDQKIRDEQAQQGQKLAQQNFQNKQSAQKANDEHAQAVLTANNTTALNAKLIQENKFDAENDPIRIQAAKLGLDTQVQQLDRISQLMEKDALAVGQTLSEEGIDPTDYLSNYADAHAHLPALVSGQKTGLYNGKPPSDPEYGATLYKSDDFNVPLTHDKTFPVYDGVDKNGNIIEKQKTLMGDGTHTVAEYMGGAMTAHAQLSKMRAQAKDVVDQKLKIAETNKANDEGIKALADAGASGAGINDGNRGLTGDAFVATLPPHLQDTVREIGNYQLDIKDLPRGKERQPIIDAAAHAYGPSGWSESKYNERNHYLQEYGTSTRGDGATRYRINNAIGHLDMLDKASQALSQHDLPTLNAIAADIGAKTGGSAKLVADSIASKAAGELAGAIKGGSGQATDPGIESALKSLNLPNMSPKQRHDVLAAQFGLLNTPVESITDKFTDAMGQTPDQFGQSVVSPKNRQILNKWVGPQVPEGMVPAYDKNTGKVIGYAKPDGTGYNPL